MIGILESIRVNGIDRLTYVGGVAAVIPDATTLASRIGVSVDKITQFEVIGADIQYLIDEDHALGFEAFRNTGLTAFLDYSKRAVASEINAFRDNANCKLIYIPAVIRLGSNTLFNSIFRGISPNSRIYPNKFLQTANNGAEEPDINDARTYPGSTIIYIENEIAPLSIYDLRVDVYHATDVRLKFTIPESQNTISYYEVFVDGILNGTYTDSSKIYAKNLTASTAYDIKVRAFDIYLNFSESNVINVTTNATEEYPLSQLVSYFKFEDNVIDSWGDNTATATNIGYTTATIGKAATFNGTTSEVLIADKDSLSFTDGTNDLPFSIVQMVKFSATGDRCLFMKGILSNREYDGFLTGANKLQFRLFNKTVTSSIFIQCTIDFTPVLGQEYVIGWTYSGNKSNSGMNIYVEAVKGTRTISSAGTYTGQGNKALAMGLGKIPAYTSLNLSGAMAAPSIFKTELTQSQMTNITNKLKAGEHLI